jgi:hypothetical protein
MYQSMHATLEQSKSLSSPPIQRKRAFSLEAQVTVALFAAALSLFSICSAVNCFIVRSGISTIENRRLASYEKPNFNGIRDLAKFPVSFDSFFRDRLFRRFDLISARSYLRYFVYGLGSNGVLAGKDGWLFYAATHGMDFIQNRPLFTNEELYWWCRLLQFKNEWCRERGIKYLFYAAPVATTIYPELLPNGLKRNVDNSRLDQLMNALNRTKSVKTVDLRPSLLAAKSFPIYLKTDTHWNSFGAYVATRPVLNALSEWFPEIRPLSLKELHLKPEHYSGNLLGFMGIQHLLSEYTLRENLKASHRWHAVNPEYDILGGNYKRTFATEVDDPSLPTAVCIRDSFSIAQREYLSNHFRRIVYEWETEWPFELIEKEKPDVVLQEKCEGTIIPLEVDPQMRMEQAICSKAQTSM